jgi:hypothetical protein
MSASSPGSGVQAHIRVRRLAAGGEAHGERRDELAKPLVARRQLGQRPSGGCREFRAQDRARGCIGGPHDHVAIDGQHSGREPRQDDREPLALSLDRLLALGRLGTGAPEFLGHVVEGVHEKAHLIARRQGQTCAEIAFADGARSLDEILHRAHEPLRGEDRAIDRRQHRQQQHQSQRQAKAVFERLALLGEIAVL